MNDQMNAFIFSKNVNVNVFILKKMNVNVNEFLFYSLNVNVNEFNFQVNVPNTAWNQIDKFTMINKVQRMVLNCKVKTNWSFFYLFDRTKHYDIKYTSLNVPTMRILTMFKFIWINKR